VNTRNELAEEVVSCRGQANVSREEEGSGSISQHEAGRPWAVRDRERADRDPWTDSQVAALVGEHHPFQQAPLVQDTGCDQAVSRAQGCDDRLASKAGRFEVAAVVTMHVTEEDEGVPAGIGQGAR
jgi:hypothetical protein